MAELNNAEIAARRDQFNNKVSDLGKTEGLAGVAMVTLALTVAEALDNNTIRFKAKNRGKQVGSTDIDDTVDLYHKARAEAGSPSDEAGKTKMKTQMQAIGKACQRARDIMGIGEGGAGVFHAALAKAVEYDNTARAANAKRKEPTKYRPTYKFLIALAQDQIAKTDNKWNHSRVLNTKADFQRLLPMPQKDADKTVGKVLERCHKALKALLDGPNDEGTNVYIPSDEAWNPSRDALKEIVQKLHDMKPAVDTLENKAAAEEQAEADAEETAKAVEADRAQQAEKIRDMMAGGQSAEDIVKMLMGNAPVQAAAPAKPKRERAKA